MIEKSLSIVFAFHFMRHPPVEQSEIRGIY